MIGQRGQRILRPVADVLEIDEVDRRPRAIERGAVVIAVRRAVLDLGRHAADLERLLGQGRRRPAAAWPASPATLALRSAISSRAAGVGVGIELVGAAVERRQPLADASPGCSPAAAQMVSSSALISATCCRPMRWTSSAPEAWSSSTTRSARGIDFVAARRRATCRRPPAWSAAARVTAASWRRRAG